jgi:hypothetical protein
LVMTAAEAGCWQRQQQYYLWWGFWGWLEILCGMLQAVRLAGVEAVYGGGSRGGEINTKKEYWFLCSYICRKSFSNAGSYVATSVERVFPIPL